MYKSISKFKIILLSLVFLFISSCTRDTCVCPDLYEPVCGSNGVTYTNSCLAECDGIYTYSYGECPITGIAEVVEVDAFTCGYVLRMGEEWYYPNNLPLSYQYGGTFVYVEFVRTSQYILCGDGYEYQVVELLFVEYE